MNGPPPSHVPGPGRRADPDARARRRAHILGAARRCFAARGFHAASTADICAEAALSVANLYQYFPSKDDLVLAVVDACVAEERDAFATVATAGDLFVGLASMFAVIEAGAREGEDLRMRTEIFAEVLRNPRVAARVRASEEATRRIVTDAVRAAQARGQVRDDVDPAAVARAIGLLADGTYVAADTGSTSTAAPAVVALDTLRRAFGR